VRITSAPRRSKKNYNCSTRENRRPNEETNLAQRGKGVANNQQLLLRNANPSLQRPMISVVPFPALMVLEKKALTDFVGPATEGRNVYSGVEKIRPSAINMSPLHGRGMTTTSKSGSARKNGCNNAGARIPRLIAPITVKGLKSGHFCFYRQAAPPVFLKCPDNRSRVGKTRPYVGLRNCIYALKTINAELNSSAPMRR
jgi:hypothetical protein